MGPIGSGAISLDKRSAVIKAFSESVERRSLLFGSKSIDEMSLAYDLLNERTFEIPTKLTKYNEYNPVVDTTGTAVHNNPDYAVYNALVELLEKNCVFLFWYGKWGRKLKVEKYKSIYTNKMEEEGLRIHLFVQDFFSPLLVVLCMVEDKMGKITYKFGTGSGFDMNSAVSKAVSEAYFLGRYHDLKNYFENQTLSDYYQLVNSPKTVNHINDLLDIEYFNDFSTGDYNELNVKSKILNIINNFPAWITGVYVLVLLQKIHVPSISVKVSSNELLTHVPFKKFIDEKVMINQKTLGLSFKSLDSLPDCPII
ncbi:YcaO-like family protein [Paenibacillus polymyxa]|uniref:YcaO-like family protein n=1 Tax=Paenibacillus polymyxa TaxID=1406 RepID=UPI001BEC0041|nr:YcaO-like family protein [Paenibacillus polymyxa]MBT2285401.1 YcaO-like family protein [Paenibacillus polymyxa]